MITIDNISGKGLLMNYEQLSQIHATNAQLGGI